jgi:hypothetical protein
MNTEVASPYGQTVALRSDLSDVECWDFTCGSLFILPAGTLVRADYLSDPTHTTVSVLDAAGRTPGLALVRKDGRTQTGYRFVVGNGALAAATGLAIPESTGDLLGSVIAYETGQLGERDTERLFRELRETAIGRRLQGRYSRMGRTNRKWAA